MKNLLYCFLCFISTCGIAQSTYFPMLDPYNSWNVTYYSCGAFTTCHFVGQDTVFNGISYKVITYESLPPIFPLTYLREEPSNKKVFNYNPYTQAESLIFDFTLLAGQIFNYTEFDTEFQGIVTNRDLVQLLDGSWRTRITLEITNSFTEEPYNVIWIEGIGVIGAEPFASWGSSSGILNCYLNERGLLWHKDEPFIENEPYCSCPPIDQSANSTNLANIISLNNIRYYPNPIQDQLYLTLPESENMEVWITDTKGKKIAQYTPKTSIQIPTNKWAEGVYIITVLINNQIVNRQKVVKP